MLHDIHLCSVYYFHISSGTSLVRIIDGRIFIFSLLFLYTLHAVLYTVLAVFIVAISMFSWNGLVLCMLNLNSGGGAVCQNTTALYHIFYTDDDMFRPLWAIFRSQKCM